MNKILLFIIFFSACYFPALAQDTNWKMDDFLKKAIIEGVKKDRLSVQLVGVILEKQSILFVAKCPICTPIKAALSHYQTIAKKKGKTKVPQKIIEGLNSTDKTANQEAFKQLIERYIQSGFTTLKLTKQQISNLQNQLASGRKQGMFYKNDNFGKFCPSCDGACGVK